MLENISRNDELNFQDLTEEEKKRRGILGRFFGPIASFTDKTRNGRKYSDEVWEKVFQSDIIKELLRNGGIPGELDHPTDREETCSERIAIMMPEAPKKDRDGHLIGYFDIVDTPCGKIAAALAKYGFKFGISSRGSGDTDTDENGDEVVEASSYDFKGWDLVLLPACEDARMNFCENINSDVSTTATLHGSLKESLSTATKDDRVIMEQTLKDLGIDYEDKNLTSTKIDVEDTAVTKINSDEAGNTGSDELIEELQKCTAKNARLEARIVTLQERLSVCYAKESKNEAVNNNYKESLRKLAEQTKTTKALSERVKSLEEALRQKEDSVRLARRSDEISLRKSLRESVEKEYQKDMDSYKKEIASLREQLSESMNSVHSSTDNLNRTIEELRRDQAIKTREYTVNLNKSKQLTEKYQKIAKIAVERYLQNQATRLGISTEDIKMRLNENYSFDDIDNACKELQRYNLTASRLPFDIENVQVKTSFKDVDPIVPINENDVIDEQLLRLTNN